MLPRSWSSRSTAVAFVAAAITLSGCDASWDRFFEGLALLILLAIVVTALVMAALTALLVANIVFLIKNRPNLTLGTTSVVTGGFVLLNAVARLFSSVHLAAYLLVPLVLGTALCVTGYQNIVRARKR